jgi:Tfp pilus assembly protein PilP
MTVTWLHWLETVLWQRPGNWPWPAQLLSFALCFGVGALGAYPLWAPDAQQWQAQINARQRRLDLSQALPAMQQQLSAAQARAAQLTSTPVNDEEALWQIAQEAGWQVLTLASDEPPTLTSQETDEREAVRPLHLRVQASFDQWRDGWQRWVAVQPALHAQAWHWQQTSAGDWLIDVQVALPRHTPSSEVVNATELHLAATALAPPRWAQLQQQRVADASPSDLQSVVHRHKALAQAAWQDLHYVGHLRSRHGVRALLRVQGADGVTRLHAVSVGDDLGPQLGRITQIDETAVTVQVWLRDAGGPWRRQRRRLPLEGSS